VNIGDMLIWESTNLLLLIPIVIGLVMLTRWFQRRTVFTDRDWRFLFGHPREEVLTARLIIRFAALWLTVVLVGLGIVFYVMPYGLGWSAGAMLLAIVSIALITPKWMR
jgi:hypothetical protein